jgi:hypothetical protein
MQSRPRLCRPARGPRGAPATFRQGTSSGNSNQSINSASPPSAEDARHPYWKRYGPTIIGEHTVYKVSRFCSPFWGAHPGFSEAMIEGFVCVTLPRIATLYKGPLDIGERVWTASNRCKFGRAEWLSQDNCSLRKLIGIHCRRPARSRSRGPIFRRE